MSIQIVMMLPPQAASVALSEACTNVFHHVEAGQNFEVLVSIGDVELTMHILDSGPGFPRGHRLADWPDVSAENGRGLALMKAFTDYASFESDDGGGSVRLKKTLRWNAAPVPAAVGE
jgi:serine/threonine-protein kinase RsbW